MRILTAILLVGFGVILGLAGMAVWETEAAAGRIYPGVSVGGITVGGLTPPQAESVLRRHVDRQVGRTLTLQLPAERLTYTYAQLGLTAHLAEAVAQARALGQGPWWRRTWARLDLRGRPVDVPIRYSWDHAAVRRLVADLAARVEVPPQDAAVTVEDGRVVLLRPSRAGRRMDAGATAARIWAALDARAPEVAAVIEVIPAAFTTEEALELRAPLASFTTSIPGNANRLHNITLAAALVRGTILAPGEVFSYNRAVGPRTAARGFKVAPVLVDNELVPGDGGGVCQVSSTLFNVALLSDLEILSRTNHSRPVPYLGIGRDATASYGALDLVFKNTTGRHLLLWAQVSGRRLTVTAYGTPEPGKTVRVLVTRGAVIPPPAGTVTKPDPLLPAGTVVTREPLPGYRVQTYRVVMVDGVVVRHQLVATSVYRPVARTIKIGTGPSAAFP